MKAICSTALLAALAFPALAQDKPAVADEAAQAKEKPAVRRHSHVEDKHHMRTAAPAPSARSAPAKPLHDHRKMHKQGG